MATRYALLFTLASLAAARTDLVGCTSSDVSSPAGASVIWYVPGTGELCEFLDCGGGAGAPVTTQPGCAMYSGTATVTPSYLPGYGPGATGSATAAAMTSSSAASSSSAMASSAVSSSSSSAAASSSVSSQASPSSLSTITTAPNKFTLLPAGPIPVNGTGATNGTSGSSSGSGSGSGSSNSGSNNISGTGSSATPSPITSNSGAMQTAQVWLGGSAILGLGALVAAL